LMRSGLPTEVPPYFWTIKAMMAAVLPEPKRCVFYWIFRGKTRLPRQHGPSIRHLPVEPIPIGGILKTEQEEEH
jgi:hypothetical protein